MSAPVPRRRDGPLARWGTLLAMLLGLALGACSVVEEQDGAPSHPMDVSRVPDATPRVEPRSRYGNPRAYVVHGRRYYPVTNAAGYRERGIASWYGRKFHGRYTSNREVYDMYAMTAAHRTLPLPSYVRVTNLENGRRVVVRVNDRGPFHDNRLIDLSYAAASRLGMLSKGTALVEVRLIDPRRPPRVEPPSPPPRHPPGLYVQVGAFAQRGNALRMRTRVHSLARGQVRIMRAGHAERRLYRVRVGPVASVEEADRLVAGLADLGISEPRLVIE